MEKRLLLGDEAIALGALHAGLPGVYAYPGTPSTEITEFIQKMNKDIHSRWCTNEKTAMEAALGMSYAGKRALVCMKHVGMNVCADAFVNSAITGVNGGLVVLAADDPSMHSSQNEQDSRFYGKFAMIPIFEPSTQQEAYDMMEEAYELSESLKLPVLMRVVTRLAHSRASVKVKEDAKTENALNPDEGRHWVLLPAIARRNYVSLIEKQNDIIKASEESRFNDHNDPSKSPLSRGDFQTTDQDSCSSPFEGRLGRVFLSLLNSKTIAFHGEPANGLQVMGMLETRNLDFRNVILIMTSNAGAQYAAQASLGFTSKVTAGDAMLAQGKKTFKPEFLNRLSGTVVFNDMDRHMANLILNKKVSQLSARLAAKQVTITLTPAAHDFILEKGFVPKYGAREMDRVLRQELNPLLTREILFGTLKQGGSATIDLKDEHLVII